MNVDAWLSNFYFKKNWLQEKLPALYNHEKKIVPSERSRQIHEKIPIFNFEYFLRALCSNRVKTIILFCLCCFKLTEKSKIWFSNWLMWSSAQSKDRHSSQRQCMTIYQRFGSWQNLRLNLRNIQPWRSDERYLESVFTILYTKDEIIKKM